MAKHYNFGVVLGGIISVKRKKSKTGTPFLQVQVNCYNPAHGGQVTTYGRLWGEQKIKEFMVHYKAHPKDTYKFRGIFAQYDKRSLKGLTRECNYTFFAWAAVAPAERRATFVLTGELDKLEVDYDETAERAEWRVLLNLNRENCELERFLLYTSSELADKFPSGAIQVKGVLIKPEDFYGDQLDEIRACVQEVKRA